MLVSESGLTKVILNWKSLIGLNHKSLFRVLAGSKAPSTLDKSYTMHLSMVQLQKAAGRVGQAQCGLPD